METAIEIRDLTPSMADVVSGAVPRPMSYGSWACVDGRSCEYIEWYYQTPAGRAYGRLGNMLFFRRGDLPTYHPTIATDYLYDCRLYEDNGGLEIFAVCAGWGNGEINARLLALNADGTRAALIGAPLEVMTEITLHIMRLRTAPDRRPHDDSQDELGAG